MLDPEVRAYLERQAGAPPRSSLSIAETRESYRKMASLAGDPPPLQRVEDRSEDGVAVRVYQPGGERLVVAYFHGGRFISGDLETHDPVCRSLAVASGAIVVAVDYRLAPEHRFPAALEDCYSAAVWASKEFGLPLAVCGDSAGGNLAAGVAMLARDRGGPAIRAQALVYPMLDASCSLPSHTEFATGYGPGTEDMKRGWEEYAPGTDPRDPRLSPLWAKDLGGLPAALILTAECDPLRDEGERYAERLREAGVEVTLMRWAGAIHGFFQLGGVLTIGRLAMAEVARFLAGWPTTGENTPPPASRSSPA